MKKNKIVRFGIVGCGVAGTRHALAISKTKNAKLLAVCSNSKKSAFELASKYLGTKVITFEKMIKSNLIDVICICSPNAFHAGQALQAIEHGKNVIVEKPLAMQINEALEILSLSKKNKVLVSEVLPRRYDKTWSGIYNLFLDKTLNDIRIITLEQFYFRNDDYYKNSNWHGRRKLDGGIILTQGIHYIDLLYSLISASLLPIQIKLKDIYIDSTGIQIKKAIGISDVISCHFSVNKKIIGSVNISTAAYPGSSARVFINCRQGNITITNDIITSWSIDKVPPPAQGTAGWNEKSVLPIVEDMTKALILKKPLQFDLQKAIDSLEFTLALNKTII